MVANSWVSLLAHWHTWHSCKPKQTLTTHLHHWFIVIVRLGVILNAFAWVIASSATWGSLWLQFSGNSWWLPPPRWPRVVEEHWHELVIICDHLPMIMRGSCAFLGRAPTTTLVDCRVIELPNLWIGSYGVLHEDEVRATLLIYWTTKCWST